MPCPLDVCNPPPLALLGRERETLLHQTRNGELRLCRYCPDRTTAELGTHAPLPLGTSVLVSPSQTQSWEVGRSRGSCSRPGPPLASTAACWDFC